MPIVPLPQFEADLAELQEEDRKLYEAMKAPKTLVVRFGAMKLVGEYPYDGDAKPGCGSKLVVKTHRGTELAEMLTSTCPNSGCGKSVSRKEILRYVENSGGKDYPFFSEGRILRVATRDDLDRQARIEQSRHALRLQAKHAIEGVNNAVKIVDVEPILGGERLTVFYTSEERVEVLPIVQRLQKALGGRVDLRHVGARDEARITADYEKCGQYCCCKNFLKVLKPVSMKSAKVQKATLDPLKISGRCGRLMCCLRYEDETYDELRKRLPHKKKRVGTPEGDGIVIDSQILTQLVLVRLDVPNPDGTPQDVAVPVENLTDPVHAVAPPITQPPVREGFRDAPRRDSRPGGPREPQRDRPREGPREGPRDSRPRDDSRPAHATPQSPGRPSPKPPPRPQGDRPLPPPGKPAQPPAGQRPPTPRHEIDEIMDSLDAGDDAPRPPHSGEGGGGRRRRRRRRRGGPPGEAGPTGGNAPSGPTP
jgi:cell fate regulator YaaT (PSP1 superfamily)